MRIKTFLVTAVVVLFCGADVWSAKLSSPWAKIKTAAAGKAESFGGPSAGCLRGATRLPESGPGYYLMRLSRGRYFGHPRLVDLLQNLGKNLDATKNPPMLIGDLSLPRGGPTMSAHSSHQTGVDVDVWYWRPKAWGKMRVPVAQRENISSVSVVNKKKLAVNGNFGEKQISLLRSFAENDSVDRVLVNFSVKRALCVKHPNEAWIRKIRPWFGHDYHFHVRLKCGDQETACKNGDEIPPGNGCDASLDWWWSDEARLEEMKNVSKQENPVMPTLPTQCSDVLSM